MKTNLEQRLKLLDEVREFTNETEKEMTFILQSLGWNREDLKKKMSTRTKCPQNSSHLVSLSKMRIHFDNCNTGLDCADELLPHNCNNNSKTIITIDKNLSSLIMAEAARIDPNFKRGVFDYTLDDRPVSQSFNQMVMTYTNDERRALYDYTISLAPSLENVLNKPTSLQYNKEIGHDATKGSLEELAMLRDMKRRRTKYKVSTKAKSYTEIMREVINNLMISHVDEINDNCTIVKQLVKRKRH